MKKLVLCLVCLSMLLGACSVNIGNGSISDVGGGTKLVNEEDMRQDGAGIQRLEVINGVGDIRIEKSDTGQIAVHVTKTVRSRDEEKKKEVMNNIKIVIEHDGESLIVNARRKDQESSSFWEWKNNLFQAMEAAIDYTIQVPEGIQVVNIQNGVGDVYLDSLKVSCQVHTGVGDVQWKGLQLTGENSVSIGTGDSILEVDPAEAKSLIVEGGVGDIKLVVPGGAKISLKARLGIGSISGSLLKELGEIRGTVETDINGGGSAVKISSGTGDIQVNKK